MIEIATFYRFAPLDALTNRREELVQCMIKSGVKGTVLLASEGLNGTISGSRQAVERVISALPVVPDNVKWSMAHTHPFARTKVKIKKEIVPLGLPAEPHKRTAPALDHRAWNQLLQDPDTIVVDVRNAFEVEFGSFKGAIDPKLAHFRQFPHWVNTALGNEKSRPIATFCTGGVRCEKLTSWMMEQGFTRVYQLDGGILKYMEECPAPESQFQGECFVFDERVALDEYLQPKKTD